MLRHAPHEHLGAIAGALERRGLSFRYVDLFKTGVRLPAPAAFRAVVVMGGPMGVYERRKYPFLTPELRFLRAFLRLDRPALGVCLGSQLLAAALGAKVYKNKHKEIGWYPLALTPAGSRDPLLRVLGKTGVVFQWHGDTFTRPDRTAHLARSPLCRHQAFRFRRNVYGLQFHLEVDAAMVRHWMGQPGAEAEVAAVGAGAVERLKKGIPLHAAGMVRRGRAFFDGWCRLIPVD